jgi:hypothetical protein
MQTFKTPDGRTFLIPGDAQRVERDGIRCECHENMGNDFYFLPKGSCLRRDGKCTKET